MSVLATLPEFPSVRESLGFQATGLMVVFIALGLIWGLMEISGAFFRRRDAAARATATPVPTAPKQPARSAADEPVDAATLAVIMAAVHCVLGSVPHRVVAVTPSLEPPLDWSREGRREHFSSHRLR